MLLASFGDKKDSPFGLIMSLLQTRAGMLNWENVTSVLIQEYEDQLMSQVGHRTEKSANSRHYHGQALAAG